jgi:hypothetical protein
MDGCATDIISQISQTPRAAVSLILKGETNNFQVTRSLLNLLHNAVIVGSLPVSHTQRQFFDSKADLVRQLLSNSKSLAWKKALLIGHPALVINIAALCPTVAGSSSLKTATSSLPKSLKKPRKEKLYRQFRKLSLND